MVDRELLSRKLSRLQGCVEVLQSAEDITWQKYQTDLRSRAFVERYLHVAIEEVIDIANHFVSFHGWREPTGYRDLFLIMAEHNGEIYDYLRLRQDLIARGHSFNSTGDTEVLLHGLIELGRDFIVRLNGIFAFALWDRRERELLLARDRAQAEGCRALAPTDPSP
jgi:hypothetical protein